MSAKTSSKVTGSGSDTRKYATGPFSAVQFHEVMSKVMNLDETALPEDLKAHGLDISPERKGK